MYTFFKIKRHSVPEYLNQLIPSGQCSYNTRNTDDVETCQGRTDTFKYAFFPCIYLFLPEVICLVQTVFEMNHTCCTHPISKYSKNALGNLSQIAFQTCDY